MKVYVDSLSGSLALKLFVLSIKYRIDEIQYFHATRMGRRVARLLQLLGQLPTIKLVELEFSAPSKLGGCMWDQICLAKQRIGKRLEQHLVDQSQFISNLPSGVAVERRQRVLLKEIVLNLHLPITLAVHAAENELKSKEPIIIFCGLSDLSPLVGKTWSAEFGDQTNIRFHGFTRLKRSRLVTLVWFSANLLRDFLKNCFQFLGKRTSGETLPPTVAIEHSRGLDGSGITNGDLWWYVHSRRAPHNCLIYNLLGTRPGFENAEPILARQGYRRQILGDPAAKSTTKKIAEYPVRTWSQLKSDLKIMLAMLTDRSANSATVWRFSLGLRLMSHVRKWQNFLIKENIKAIFYSEETSIDGLSLAADLEGAIRFGYHWSSLQPANLQLVPLHQVYFTWGPFYTEIVRDENAACSEIILESGCIFGEGANQKQKSISSQFTSELNCDVQYKICVFDRSLGPLGYFGISRHRAFFEELLELAEENRQIGLVFKFKDSGRPRLFKEAPDIEQRIESLIKAGRACRSNSDAASAAAESDIVVAMAYNSAGIVAEINGSRAIYWDPTNLLSGPFSKWVGRLGWKQGKNVFARMENLSTALKTEVESLDRSDRKPATPPTLTSDIDPYRDGLAACRIAEFMDTFLDGLEAGSSRNTALIDARDKYKKMWPIMHKDMASSWRHLPE